MCIRLLARGVFRHLQRTMCLGLSWWLCSSLERHAELGLACLPQWFGRGLLWGNNGLNHDGMEVGGFRFSGGLVGGLSLCGSHWDCFLSWNMVGATVGIFAPEGY